MSSLLRSSKFFKGALSLRSLASPKSYISPAKASTLRTVSRDFARAAAQREGSARASLERHINRLDQDVRRSGRVSFRELQEIFQQIQQSKNATSSQALMIIRCCGNLLPQETPSTRLGLVEEIWKTLEKQGVIMDVSHYNALLLVYLENEHRFDPQEWLESMRSRGVEPNRVTLQRLVAVYCQRGDIPGATGVLQMMKDQQMPIGESVFNSLITGHSNARDMASAEGTLGVMEQAGLEPSVDTLTALLCGYARGGDVAGLGRAFDLAETKGVRLRDRHLLEVVHTLAVCRHEGLIDMVVPRLSREPGYNQDAKNCILRLVSQGCDEAAMRLFYTMTPVESSGDEALSLGTFIIKHMVKMGRPYEKIRDLCQELKAGKLNDRALHTAIESSLILGRTDLSLRLLSDLANEEPLCQHYYWPVIKSCAKANDTQGLIKTLKEMSVALEGPVPNETLRDYVVEHLGSNSNAIATLRQAGITVASAASAMLAHHLTNSDFPSAIEIASKYRANFNLLAVKRGLVSSYRSTKDAGSAVEILRCIIWNMSEVGGSRALASPSLDSSSESSSESSGDEGRSGDEVAGQVLLELATSVTTDRPRHIASLLERMVEAGLRVSEKSAEQIQDLLSGGDLTPEISGLLTKLTSADLLLLPLERGGQPSEVNRHASQQEEKSLLERLASAEAKEESGDGFRLQLLDLYTRLQDQPKAATLRQELKDRKVEIPKGNLAELLGICVRQERLEEAMVYYKELISRPEVPTLPELTLIGLASLLIQADRIDEGVAVFERHPMERAEGKEFSHTSQCWKLLNALASAGQAPQLRRVFDAMLDAHFIVPNNVLLGPLVKVHLVRGEVDKALERFEELSTLYRATPWKNELACKLILAEDAAGLQRLTDLSSRVHGEVNSLYDLVLSLVECGRTRQARNILETPGLRTRPSRLSAACLRYQNEGHVTHLENLVDVTKDLPHIDRSDLYYHLLITYCNKSEVDKAEGLWTRMQEEDVAPSDRFLVRLANLLTKHNRPVPFTPPNSVTSDRFYTLQKKTEEPSKLKEFRQAVYGKDLDRALAVNQTLEASELQVSDRSALLSLLINNGRVGEATRALTGWLEAGLRPNIRTLNYLINTVAKAADIHSLTTIGNLLGEDLKRLTSFSNRLTHCMVEAGKGEEVLERLERDLDAADTPPRLEACRRQFPRGGVYSIFSMSPHLLPRFEKLTKKYQEKGILEPVNSLWVHYLVTGEDAKADELWPVVKRLERIMYQPVIKKCKAERDLPLVQRLHSLCSDANVGLGSLGAVLSAELDILMMLDRLDDCCNKLDEAVKEVSIENLNFVILKKIKSTLEREGRIFKYTIPPKPKKLLVKSTTASDSDSDDELRQKA